MYGTEFFVAVVNHVLFIQLTPIGAIEEFREALLPSMHRPNKVLQEVDLSFETLGDSESLAHLLAFQCSSL